MKLIERALKAAEDGRLRQKNMEIERKMDKVIEIANKLSILGEDVSPADITNVKEWCIGDMIGWAGTYDGIIFMVADNPGSLFAVGLPGVVLIPSNAHLIQSLEDLGLALESWGLGLELKHLCTECQNYGFGQCGIGLELVEGSCDRYSPGEKEV